jgi:phosphoglycerate dehydrogenase-like enzyme
MSQNVRVGLPSFISSHLLADFPPGAELVAVDAAESGELPLDFLLAPWNPRDAEAALARVRGVRVVQAFSAGVETLLPILPAGAVLCDARGLHDAPTAEWTVAAVLAALKHFPLYDGLQREGRWRTRPETDAEYDGVHGAGSAAPFPVPVLVEELEGKRVLIVGYGSIGEAIEARLLPFGPIVTRVARRARPGVHPVEELHSLLPDAEIVVLITPLTPETHHLIGVPELALLPRGALVVNAARGGVIDTDALVSALEQRRVRAALDVTDPEPLPQGHPLWRAPNLLLTPHIAGSSPQFLRRVVGFTRQQVERLLRDEPLINVVEGHY